jgi:Family of unknown function (DUF5723)
MKKLIAFIILAILNGIILVNILTAQTGTLGLGSKAFMPNIMANPAFTSDARMVIGLPLLSSFQLEQQSSFKLTDWLSTSAGKTYLSFDKFAPLAQPNNNINTNLGIDIASIGFRVKKDNFFSLGLQHFSSVYISISDDLVKLVAQGNGNNASIVLNEESAYASQFNALYLGYARNLMNDKLKIGVRLKRLQGLNHFQTDNVNFNITTSATSIPAYAINVTGSLKAQAGGILGIATDTLLNNNLGNNISKNLMTLGSGMGFDFGISYQVTNKLNISASAVNVGSISWNKDFAGKVELIGTGKFDFAGIKTDLNNTSSTTSADAIERNAKDAFKIEQSKAAFTSALPSMYYFSAGYQLSEKHQFTGVYRMQKFNTKSNSVAGLTYGFSPLKAIQLLAGVNSVNFKSANFGGGLVWYTAGTQLHFLVDNISGLAAVDNTNRLQIQAGLNIVLKKKAEKDQATTLELGK